MSLASDRAAVIAASMRADGRPRQVFVMSSAFTLRIVSVPLPSTILTWVRAHSWRRVGRFEPGATAYQLEQAIERAWAVPRGTSQVPDSGGRN